MNRLFITLTALLWIVSISIMSFTTSKYFSIAWMLQIIFSLSIGAIIVLIYINKKINKILAMLIYILVGTFITPKIIFQEILEIEIYSSFFSFKNTGFFAFIKILVFDSLSILIRSFISFVLINIIYIATYKISSKNDINT